MDISRLPFGFNENSRECQELKERIQNKIVELYWSGIDEFYTDCTFGFPLWCGEIVTALMMYNDVMLFIVFPHENQPHKLAEDWRDRLFALHEKCTDVIPMYTEYDEESDSIVFLNESEEELEKRAVDYMLEKCGTLLFCGLPNDSYIYKEAVKLGLEIIVLII